ncbi:MAG TPA: phage portal protein, partial [Steroidobacteraceae bacterium]
MDGATRPTLRQKTAEFFNSFFDYGSGSLARGFYPVAAGGQARPPINAAKSAAGTIVTPNTALALSTVWGCVWLMANAISSLPFILNRRSGANLTYGAPAFDVPLYTVLNSQPNSQMSAVTFWKFIVASEELWGNGYAFKTLNSQNQLIALDPLRPEYMVPYRQWIPGTEPKQYEIRYRYYSPLESLDFSADQIFHWKDRTMDGLVGLSRIEYARHSMGIARAAEDSTSETFKNGLRAGGFVQSDKWLNQKNRDEIHASLRKFSTGGPESGGIMVLEGGLKFGAITMNPQDVQLLASRQFSVEDICRWFQVPPVLVGHAAAGVTAWGSGIEQLLLGWSALSLRSYVRGLEQEIQRSLVAVKDRPTLYTTVDLDDLLAADSAARSALYSTFSQNGIMTRNEIRAKEDLPPADGGDELTVQSNLMPLGKLGEPPPQAPAPVHNIFMNPTAAPPPAKDP